MDRGGRRGEVLVAAAGDRERVVVDLEPVGEPRRGGERRGRPRASRRSSRCRSAPRARPRPAAAGATGAASVPRRARAARPVKPGSGAPSAQPQRTLKSVSPSRFVSVGERACPTWRALAVSSRVLGGLRAPRRAAARARCSCPSRSRSPIAIRSEREQRRDASVPVRGSAAGRARAARSRRRRSRARGARSSTASGGRVVGARRQRQRRLVLAAVGAARGPRGVRVQPRERVAEPLDAADVVERELGDERVLDRPVHVLGRAAPERGHEAAEVLDQVAAGSLGHAREPGGVAERLGEARLAQQQLGLPARPQPGRRVAHEREAQPAVLGQDPLALLALIGREAVLAAATGSCRARSSRGRPRAWRSARRRRAGARRARRAATGPSCSPPWAPARRGPLLGQDDGALGDVARERRLHPRASLSGPRAASREHRVAGTAARSRILGYRAARHDAARS